MIWPEYRRTGWVSVFKGKGSLDQVLFVGHPFKRPSLSFSKALARLDAGTAPRLNW